MIRRYSRLLAPYARTYVLGLLLLLITNALSLLVPRLVKGAVDALAIERGVSDSALPSYFGGLLESPMSYVYAMAIAAVILAVARSTSRIVILGAGRSLRRDLSQRLFDRLLEADPAFYSRFPTGEILSRCRSDVQIMQAVAAPGILYIFNGVFMFGIAVPYMFSVSSELATYLLIPYPFLAVLTMITATKVKAYSKQAQAAMADLTTHLQETLSGIEVVKAFTLEEHQARRFEASNDVFLEKSMKEAITRGGIGIAAVLTGGIGSCVILYFGGRKVAEGVLTYGDLALYLSLMALVLRPTIFLGWVMSLAQRGMASMDRIDELLDAPLAVAPPETAENTGPVVGAVHVEGLTFRYPSPRDDESDRRLALDDVSFSVPAGGVLGLVGRIGSGKSTLLRAIPRFLDAPDGSVVVDGIPVERWDLPTLRRGIGYVPQDGAVFSMSLGANVAFGAPDANDPEVLKAAELAELSKDLDQLEAGLETMVGERGVTLSGGQRQRLAIARAIMGEPKVLLLDDALSMVDAETAVAVLDNLRRELGDTTAIVSAHRTATLLGCNEILVLEQGKIVERGAPQELLETEDSLFARMHERQRLSAEILESS